MGVAAAIAARSILRRAGAAASVAAAAAKRSALPLVLLVITAMSSKAALWNRSCQTAPAATRCGMLLFLLHCKSKIRYRQIQTELLVMFCRQSTHTRCYSQTLCALGLPCKPLLQDSNYSIHARMLMVMCTFCRHI